MNYTERKAKNQVFFYITSGSGFMTPLISVLIIPGAVSTAVNMVAAMVKRICNGIEKRLLKKGRVKKRKFFMRPFSYKYNSSYISQKSV